MSPEDMALKSSVEWLVSAATTLTTDAVSYTKHSDRLLDKATVLLECASLPGDMPIRVRCFPNVLNLRA